MQTAKTIPHIRSFISKKKKRGSRIGFVPTMGALHEGHLSLIRRAKDECNVVVLSIYVNPTQFGPKEDFKRYPRPLRHDIQLARSVGTDIVFLPQSQNIYPEGFKTFVEVEQLSDILCGRSRPGHFRGVATVVAKLLNIVQPDRLYLGQKDGQQAILISKMVDDLNIPVRVRVCPTVREPSGLAMSSRNTYLSDSQHDEAAQIYQALKKGKQIFLTGENSSTKIIHSVRRHIENHSSGKVEYVACVDGKTGEVAKTVRSGCMFACAVWFGKTRLIDNIVVRGR